MAASQEQKVDFLLKKIGYTASKTGIAEDETGISGTKKAPFAEPIPSPLTLPGANVWAQSNQIPTTPPVATTSIVRVYKTGTAQKLTFDSTVAGNRSFVSRETPGEVTSTVVGDWVDTQFGSDYIVKVYKGDPNSGGVQLSAAGSGSNDTWFFDYSAGVLNFNGTNVPAGISTDNIFIEGYRYTGIKGVTGVAQTFTDLEISGITTFNGPVDMNSTLDVDGDTQLDDLNVSGVATFSNTVDINSTLDVDGDTQLDDLTVAGVATFSSNIDANGTLDVDGHTELDNLNVSGVSTFTGISTNTSQLFTNGLEVAGVTTFRGNSVLFRVGNEINFGQPFGNSPSGSYVVFHGGHSTGRNMTWDAGSLIFDDMAKARFGDDGIKDMELWHSGTNANIKFDGGLEINSYGKGDVSIDSGLSVVGVSTLRNLNVTGISTLNSDVRLSSGLNVSGVSTFSALVDANNRLDVVGGANIDQLNVAGVSTFLHNVGVSGTVSAVNIKIPSSTPGQQKRLFIGDGSTAPMQIYYDSNNSNSNILIQNSTGGLNIRGEAIRIRDIYNTVTSAVFNPASDVQLRYSNSVKFATTNTGINVTGLTDTDSLLVSGVSTFTGNIDANGTLDVDGDTQLDDLNVAGVATFSKLIDANNRLDVVGGANLDQLNVAGVSTFAGIATFTGSNLFARGFSIAGVGTIVRASGASLQIESKDTSTTRLILKNSQRAFSLETINGGTFQIRDGSVNSERLTIGSGGLVTILNSLNINKNLDVDGDTQLDDLNVAGVSTFSSLVDIDAGGQANSFKVEDLTNNRLIIAGTGGELEDSSKVTFDGSTLAVVGDATFTGNVTIGGTLIKEDITNIDSIGIVTAGRGVRVTAGGLVVSSGLGTFSDSAYFPDNSKIKFGDATTADLEIYHSGAHSFISDQGTGSLKLLTSTLQVKNAGDSATMITAVPGSTGSTKLYQNNDERLATTREGVLVSGGTTTGTLSVTGVTTTSGLLDINAGGQANTFKVEDLTSGRVVLVGTGGELQDHGGLVYSSGSSTLTLSGNQNITGNLTIDSSGSLTSPNADITGGLSVTGVSTFTGITTSTSTLFANQLSVAGISSFHDNVILPGNNFGNIGIGVLNPGTTNRIDIAGTGNQQIQIRRSDGNNGFIFKAGSSHASIFTYGGQHYFRLLTDSVERLLINNTGITTLTGNVFAHKDIDVAGNAGIGSLNVTGVSTFKDDVEFHGAVGVTSVRFDKSDNSLKFVESAKLKFGSNFEIFQDANGTSRIHATDSSHRLQFRATDFRIAGSNGLKTSLRADTGGSVKLYFDNNLKFNTNSSGAKVTGDLNVTGVTTTGTLNVTGLSTFVGVATFNGATFKDDVEIRSAAPIFKINKTGTSELTSIYNNNAATLAINDTTNGAQIVLRGQSPKLIFDQASGGSGSIYYDNTDLRFYSGTPVGGSTESTRFSIGGINVGGGVTAGAFYGDGSNLTGIGTQNNLGAFDNLVVSGVSTFHGTVGVITATSIKSPKYDGDADGNVIMGCCAGAGVTDTITTGINNVLIGRCAGKSVQKCFNVMIGLNAGCCAESGSGQVGNGSHVLIGLNAGQKMGQYGLTGGYNNTFIGSQAGQNQTCPNANVALGNAAAIGTAGCKGGSCNIAIGFRANHDVKSNNNNNIAIGRLTGFANSTGCNNVWMGNTSGMCQIGGSGNVLLGMGTRQQAVGGNHNIAIGCYANCANNSQNHNIYMGYFAGKKNGCCGCANGCFNIAMGCAAGCYGFGCHNNIAIGHHAGQCAKDCAGSNILMGQNAGKNVTCLGNVIIGHSAGVSVTNGQCNTIIGSHAGAAITAGNLNILIGAYTGRGITCGSHNVMMGRKIACTSGATGTNNLVLGQCAAMQLSSGSNNVILGSSSGRCITTGCFNVLLGSSIGMGITTGSHNFFSVGGPAACGFKGCRNIAIGHIAMNNATIDTALTDNIALGFYAGQMLAGSTNIMLGFKSGQCSNVANHSIFLGQCAGMGNTTGGQNIAIGRKTGGLVCGGTGDNNISFGHQAGTSLVSGSNNILIGCDAGRCVTTGNYNITLGHRAGCTIHTATKTISIGFCAGRNQCGGAGCNIFIGSHAGGGITTGSTNVALGDYAAGHGTNFYNLIAIGCCSAAQGMGSGGGIAIGSCAAKGATANIIAIGGNAGCQTTGANSVFIGSNAGLKNTSGCHNAFLGQQSGQQNTTGCCNTFIGHGAASGNTTGTGNISLGMCSGPMTIGASGCKNFFGGYKTGNALTTGSCNTFLGAQAGNTTTEGSFNIAIGYDVELPSATGDDQLAIGCGTGRWIAGDSSFKVTLAGIVTATAGGAVCANSTTLKAYAVDTDIFSITRSDHASSKLFRIFQDSSSGGGAGGAHINTFNRNLMITASASAATDSGVYLRTTGQLGIGTNNPTSKLDVVGDAKVSGVVTATDFDATSDIRLKTNIQPIDDPIAKVVQIEGVSFNWKKDDRPALGVIADQVEKILPQLVHGDDPKTVNYNGLVGLLIEVVKDQQNQIDTLNERISKLE